MEKVVKNPIAVWDNLANEAFCEICASEVIAGNRPTGHLNAKGYKNLAEKFLAKTGRVYDKKQFKNKWDGLKAKFSIWKELKHAATGLGWNVVNGTIEAYDDWWAEKIKACPKYAHFRKAPLEHIDNLEVMFQGVSVTSHSSVIPGIPAEDTRVHDISDGDDVADADDDDVAVLEGASKVSGKATKRKGISVGRSPKKGKKSPMMREVTRLVDHMTSSNSSTSDNKADDEIIEHMRMAVRSGVQEGSDKSSQLLRP